MIRFLSIQNLAVVDALELEFEHGLTVLTGETGAGKSVIISALGLLVGSRATGDLVRTGEEKAIVQATIEVDQGQEVILKREVNSQGRSRAFIDDSLATSGALKDFGRQVFDLHGQHEHQALLDPKNHLELLDAYCRSESLTDKVDELFNVWRLIRSRLEKTYTDETDRAKKIELLAFQRGDIDRVKPAPTEDEEIKRTRERLMNAERLATLSTKAYAELYDQDNSAFAILGRVWRHLEELAELDPDVQEQIKERDAITSQLEELSFFLRSYAGKVETSTDRLTEVEARLSTLEELKRKYGPLLQDVLGHRDRISDELNRLSADSTKQEELVQQEKVAGKEFLLFAEKLSARRKKEAKRLSAQLTEILKDLAMPQANFEIRFEADQVLEKDWNETGIDRVQFYFSANLGETARPLAKVASGGELSRVMLGLKSLVSTDKTGKTLVFDEVDSGIGGAVSNHVGSMLLGLSKRFQVLCVTHLPQIAAYATSHHHVSKTVRNGRTVVKIERLEEERRVSELARLMTGGVSSNAQAGARELLKSKEKEKAKGERRK